jgi:transposase
MQLQLYGNKIFLCRSRVDFRRSIDGLSAFVLAEMKGNPKEAIYLFINRGRDKIKCLFWHKNGFALLYKRLEKGRFSMDFNNNTGTTAINFDEFTWLLAGLEWHKMKNWKELSYDKFS